MSILANPTQKSPERAFALQKYLLLHSQHDALQKHLQNISKASEASSTSPSSLSSSPTSASGSPPGRASFSANYHAHRHHHRSSSASFEPSTMPPIPELPSSPTCSNGCSAVERPGLRKRRSSLPLTLTTAPSLSEIDEEEMKLMNINQQIKTTLTELLNCESVRGDGRYRMWVQNRLMDVEMELRDERSASRVRRKSLDVDSIRL